MSLYNILDEAIGFQKKLERDTHDRLMSKKEDVIIVHLFLQILQHQIGFQIV
jgi:hypothetical protein